MLAGQHFSRNAAGAVPADIPAADLVDRHWRDYVDDAVAVLKTLREPDEAMLAAGASAPRDRLEEVWEAMIRAAAIPRAHAPLSEETADSP